MGWRLEYPIVRPYPFRYFTAIVVVLLLLATILLSLFNLIVTGYDLRVSYSTSPNETMAQKMWYDKAVFSGISKLSTSCEPKEINVQTNFHTNKKGFVYSLNNIRQVRDGEPQPVSSMLYLNNVLSDCEINYIKIEMAKHLGRTAQQVAWSRFGPQLLAAISCSMDNMQGSARFNFTTEYDLIPPTANKGFNIDDGGRAKWAHAAQQNLFQFVASNNKKDPAMWWAESLLSFAWLDTALRMEEANNVGDYSEGKQWQSGSINFWLSGNTPDIKSDIFFARNYYILQDGGSIFIDGRNVVEINESSDRPMDRMLYSADLLARSFYSAIPADIGIVDGPNVLTDETALQKFTRNYSSIVPNFGLVAAGPATDSYNALKDQIGKPEVTRSTIFTSFLCQRPERKLTTSLIVSVLLADLVLLRAIWKIITMVAIQVVNAKDPKANHCMQCIKYETIPLSERDSLPAKSMATSRSFLLGQERIQY